MNHQLLFPSLVVSLALAACTSSTTVTSSSPDKGKPTAPVAVSAELSSNHAKVTVRFESDASEVSVSASGVDGLTVSEGHLGSNLAVARGETRTFDVAYTPGEGRSELVVTVKGTFNGAHRARVTAFGVGAGSDGPADGTVMTTDDGETVKVMPTAQ